MSRFMLVTQTLVGGGAERMVARLSTYLKKNGHEVIVVLSYRNDNEYTIDCNQIETIAEDAEKYKNCGKLKRLMVLRKLFYKYNPDIIIPFLNHIGKYVLISTFASKYRKRVVVTIRNNPLQENFFEIKKMIKQAKLCVAQNIGQKDLFDKHLQDKIIVIPNFVDENLFLEEKHYSKKVHFIIATGRLTVQKNYFLLLEAFKECHFSDVKLYIYGIGELSDSIVSWIKEHHLEEKIILKGFSNQIKEAMLSSDLYVMSSNFEGMPNSLLEASALGLPVISTDCPYGPSDIIKDHKTGILVPCDNVQALKDALLYFYENPLKCLEYGRQGKKYAMEKYSYQRIITLWEDIVNKIQK